LKEGIKWIYRFLTSKGLAIGLFGAVSLIAIPGTFMEKKNIYSSPIFITILGLMCLNLLLCTLKRLKTLSMPVLILHGGVILTVIGSVISSFGFVATVNIYEGTSVNKAYRWDIKEDISLLMDLTVKKINIEYYPIPVRVGVLKGEKRAGLFELKTGESFNLEGYTVNADTLELPSENLRLSVFNQGHLIGAADTSGGRDLPADFPYRFVLVAFKNPHLKRMGVDLKLSRESEIIAEGSSEVNRPFKWQGLYFHHTSTGRDRYGIPFAGIQITKDPGRPYVFLGFSVMGIGAVLYLGRRIVKGK
jgi:hypothetical protein